MLNNISSAVVLSSWAALLALIIGTSIWVGASTSTVVLLIALCAGSGIVMFLLAHKAPAKSVADILYSIEAKDGRR